MGSITLQETLPKSTDKNGNLIVCQIFEYLFLFD